MLISTKILQVPVPWYDHILSGNDNFLTHQALSLLQALLRGDDEEAVSGPDRLFRRACVHYNLHQPVPRHQDHYAPVPALSRHTALPLVPAGTQEISNVSSILTYFEFFLGVCSEMLPL